jgi:hypothetical protein
MPKTIQFSLSDNTDVKKERSDSSLNLPIEILLCIFLVLEPRALLICVPQVCRRWRDACKSMPPIKVDMRWVCKDPKFMPDIPLTDSAALVPNLQIYSLNLSGCWNLTDAWLEKFVTRCPKMTALDLTNCGRVTDEGLKKVAARCPHLLSLDLSGCDQVTVKGLEKIATGCRNLTSIYLSGENVTDTELGAIAICCANLTSLNISGCKNVTDAGLEAIAGRCPDLTSLNLSECWSLTDKGLEMISAGCIHLITLDISYCDDVTIAGLEKVATRCPHLATCNLSGLYHERCDIAPLLAKLKIKYQHLNFINNKE